jgi:hypothetical protein
VKIVRFSVFWHVAARSSDVSEWHTASTFSSDTLLATSRLPIVACMASKGRTVDDRRVKVSRSYRGTLLAFVGLRTATMVAAVFEIRTGHFANTIVGDCRYSKLPD